MIGYARTLIQVRFTVDGGPATDFNDAVMARGTLVIVIADEDRRGYGPCARVRPLEAPGLSRFVPLDLLDRWVTFFSPIEVLAHLDELPEVV